MPALHDEEGSASTLEFACVIDLASDDLDDVETE